MAETPARCPECCFEVTRNGCAVCKLAKAEAAMNRIMLWQGHGLGHCPNEMLADTAIEEICKYFDRKPDEFEVYT